MSWKSSAIYLAPPTWLRNSIDHGVLDECLLQFSSAPVEQHNRNSVELFDVGGRFYADVMAFKETGQMSRQLAFRFASIRDMPMDDKVAERPHAIGSRIGTLARGSHWPWDSASMRLPETLLDKETLVGKYGGSLQKLCDNSSPILQKKKRLFRPVRLTHAEVCKKVYFSLIRAMNRRG